RPVFFLSYDRSLPLFTLKLLEKGQHKSWSFVWDDEKLTEQLDFHYLSSLRDDPTQAP
uniref:Uncharacterized protein n=2 Tax=Sus scrofa TaxID=9823 RepID=A0A8D0ZZJ1_PIG